MRMITLIGGPFDGALFDHNIYIPDFAFPDRFLLGQMILTSSEVHFYVRTEAVSDTYCVYQSNLGKFRFLKELPTNP